jgi:hypothetical protein
MEWDWKHSDKKIHVVVTKDKTHFHTQIRHDMSFMPSCCACQKTHIFHFIVIIIWHQHHHAITLLLFANLMRKWTNKLLTLFFVFLVLSCKYMTIRKGCGVQLMPPFLCFTKISFEKNRTQFSWELEVILSFFFQLEANGFTIAT